MVFSLPHSLNYQHFSSTPKIDSKIRCSFEISSAERRAENVKTWMAKFSKKQQMFEGCKMKKVPASSIETRENLMKDQRENLGLTKGNRGEMIMSWITKNFCGTSSGPLREFASIDPCCCQPFPFLVAFIFLRTFIFPYGLQTFSTLNG